MAEKYLRSMALLVLPLVFSACGSSSGSSPAGSASSAATASRAPVSQARLSGPIGDAGTRGHALWDSWYRLSDLGYVEEEYFVSGTALSRAGAPDADYTTRFIIRRPADADDFNGTVVLDWVNVTAQFENPVDSLEAHDFLRRNGYAYAHVSMQAAGICCNPLTPMTWDPARYGELNHPGDDYAFNMLAQIAQAIREPGELDPMAGLAVEEILAAGQSQSANQLFEYVTGGFADNRQIDGFLIHSSIDRVFDQAPPVPVLHLLSDFEARPVAPGTDVNLRLWEIAGAAHQDFYVGYHQEFGQAPRASANAPQQPGSADEDLHAVAGNYGEQPHPLHGGCIVAGAAFPMRYAVDAALHHLNRWVRGNGTPPRGARYQFDDQGQLARDAFGNALGGIRYPPIEVPVARYRSTDCELGGITVPFTEAELLALYPTHADYFCQMQAAAERSVAQGFLLPADAEDLMQRVEDASNRFLLPGVRDCDDGG